MAPMGISAAVALRHSVSTTVKNAAPSNAAAGAAITPAVQVCVQDGVGNTVTNATNNITIAIGTNPGSATLGGTVTAAAVSGCTTFANLTLRQGRVMKFGGLRQPVEDLARAAPGAWAVRLGEARLAYPPERDNLLHRLGVGRPLAGYWSRLRASYSITPR